jgi:hypothetical protein
MALKRLQQDRPPTVGHVSHDSLVRVDRRVKDITRRQAALHQARRAAERLQAATSSRGGI